MKSLMGISDGVAERSLEACFELLADIEGYPNWYPKTVKRAVVIERDASGRPLQVSADLTLAEGLLRFDQAVPLQVTLEHPTLVRLSRVPDDTHDEEQLRVQWDLEQLAAEQTRLRVELGANLNLPPFLPELNSMANGVARGFLDAALAALNGG